MILITILMFFLLALAVKLTFVVFRILGKLAGFFLSIFGFALLGIIAIPVLGITIIFLPVLIIAGIIALIAALIR